MPWLFLLKANAKPIMALVALFIAMGAGYQLKAKLCALEVAEIKQSIVNAVTEEEERQRQEAEKLQKKTIEIKTLRKELNRRILDAKDSSFGCVVNDDGMRLLTDAIGNAPAINARAMQ